MGAAAAGQAARLRPTDPRMEHAPARATDGVPGMRHLLLLPLLALAPPALAQQPGLYALQGTDVDGAPYAGTVELARTETGAWRVVWRIDGAELDGIGLVQGNVLAVAYPAQAQLAGVVAWQILPDGRLDGAWTADGRLGREVLTPMPGTRATTRK